MVNSFIEKLWFLLPIVTAKSPTPVTKVKDVEIEPQIKQKEQTPDNTIVVMKTPNKEKNEPEVVGEFFYKCGIG